MPLDHPEHEIARVRSGDVDIASRRFGKTGKTPASVACMRLELPKVRLVAVDAGHNIPGDNPAALLQETRAFLESTGN